MFLQCWFLLQINVFFWWRKYISHTRGVCSFWLMISSDVEDPPPVYVCVCVCDDDDVETHANIALKVRYVRFLSLSRMNKPLGFFRICLRTEVDNGGPRALPFFSWTKLWSTSLISQFCHRIVYSTTTRPQHRQPHSFFRIKMIMQIIFGGGAQQEKRERHQVEMAGLISNPYYSLLVSTSDLEARWSRTQSDWSVKCVSNQIIIRRERGLRTMAHWQ